MTGTSLVYVEAEGSPRDVGGAHGREAGDLIRRNLDLYFHRFEAEWGLPKEEVLDRARRYEEVVAKAEPDYLEALRGVAEGSGLPEAEVLALNLRYEIVYSESSRRGLDLADDRLPSGCTSLALLPHRTVGAHLLMAQNWDWIPGIKAVVVKYRLDGGPTVLAFTEAGIVGPKIGLNSAGLGLLINGMLSDQDNWERFGVPFHVRCWQILRCETLDAAARVVRDSLGSCSANFVLGQARGNYSQILDLESSPVGTTEVAPSEGVLTHANHFHNPDALGIWQPLIYEKTSTFERQERIDELLPRGSTKELAIPDIQAMLQDHENAPKSLCRHPMTELPEEERYQTVVSAIMDVDARRFLIAHGPPCETEYLEYSLET
ncbi:MAG: C45 family peptidase [Candidatus Thermoplasmatota archaeon]|nr:C45 family peptidase [Candidatus Thermoplasmatota archaeon]